jgi:hypothetical protein
MSEPNRQHWLPGNPGAAVALRGNWVAALRRFVDAPEAERCEFCGTALPLEHTHLIKLASRRLVCACEVCVATMAASANGGYRVIVSGARPLADFRMTDAEWEALRLPIDMTFVFHSTPEGRPIALYPGPAGATESLLGLDAWERIVANNPELADLQPDVEALLVNRLNGAREYYRVSIDRCFALVGLIRIRWRGLSGGPDAWAAIHEFFDGLRGSAESARGLEHD